MTEFSRDELADDSVKRLSQRVKKSLDGSPPKHHFLPLFEQVQPSKKVEDKEIEQSLQPKKAVPAGRKAEDEETDSLDLRRPRIPDLRRSLRRSALTKSDALSKAGREQLADKGA